MDITRISQSVKQFLEVGQERRMTKDEVMKVLVHPMQTVVADEGRFEVARQQLAAA